LYPVLPGIYAVGHPALAPLAREVAALLWAGPDAVISHDSAACVWGIGEGAREVHVTIRGRHLGRRPGVRVHRVERLSARDVGLREGLPVTAPARTLIDVAAGAVPRSFERAVSEARVQRLVTDSELAAAVARCPGRAGVASTRALLEAERGPAITRSHAEARMLELLRRAELELPLSNARLHGYEVDFLWRDAMLVVEVDGYAYHAHRAAFERDRTRDQVLVAAGYRVIRVTWRQLEHEPLAVVARIAQALAP
jgi:very-short-patch-repair endonuclease